MQSSGKPKDDFISPLVKHALVEKVALWKAIKYLLDSDTTLTVLVDILERENGQIKMLPSGHFDVHTVVLYKNPALPDGKCNISVIDPSNFSFSRHLSNSDAKINPADLQFQTHLSKYLPKDDLVTNKLPLLGNIITAPQDFPIYS